MVSRAKAATGGSLSIGQLAKVSGVGVDAIRFYERRGLLPTPVRKASGYRVYGRDAAARLGFIRRAQTFGFSLDEIAVLLRSREEVGGAAAAKSLAQVKLKDDLAQLVNHCPGSGEASDCPILRAFEPAPRRQRSVS